MANDFVQDAWGGFQNFLASGKVYDSRTNTYAPNSVRVPRTIAGIAGQLNPIVGVIGGQLANHLPAGSTAWDQRLKAPLGVVQQFDSEHDARNAALDQWAGQQIGGHSPSVSVGPAQPVSAGGLFGGHAGGLGGMLGGGSLSAGLFDNFWQQNQQNAQSRMDQRMQDEQDRIQAQIDATYAGAQGGGRPSGGGFGGGGRGMSGAGAASTGYAGGYSGGSASRGVGHHQYLKSLQDAQKDMT